MKSPNRTHAFLAALFALPLLFSCDSKSGGSGPGDPVTTNFRANLSTLLDSLHGLPDSVVAQVRIDGAEVRRVVLGPSDISENGLIHFPVDATEGSRIEVSYAVWKGGGVEAASTVKWVSGEPLAVPRPDLAPTLAIETGAGSGIVLRRDAKVWFRTSSRDPEGALAALGIDWNGDGTLDDSLVPPSGRDSILVSWGAAGTYLVEAVVRDRGGLVRRDTLRVRVLDAARISLSPDTAVSIGDSVDLRIGLDLDDSINRSSVRLVWIGVGARPETTSVLSSRRLAWTDPGIRTLQVAVLDPAGEASRDTVRVEVLQDAPVLDLSRIPGQVDRGAVVLLSAAVQQRFGSIVRWGIDFDGDTTSGWDSVLAGAPKGVEHLFAGSGTFAVRVFVLDDDGNRVVGSRDVFVGSSNEGLVLRRTSPRDTLVSIHDTTEIRFVRNFASGAEADARLEWRVDDGPVASEPVGVLKRLVWDAAGRHRVAWRVAMPSGTTLWDTVEVTVEQDPPVLDRESFPVSASLNAPRAFAPRAIQKFGTLVRWGLDFDGDTTGSWDTVVSVRGATVLHTFDQAGDARVLVFLEDDDGNRVVDSAVIPVRADGLDLLLRTSEPLVEVSIGDSVPLTFRTNLPAGLASSYAVEWVVDGASPETTAVAATRSFRWNGVGEHLLRFRAFGPGGAASWDSTRVRVVLGVPVIRSIRTVGSGVGEQILFSANVDPVHGRIVRTRWDFGDDGTWDDSTVSPDEQVRRTFGKSARVAIRLQVVDDDGNRVDTLFGFAPANAAPRFGLVSFAEASVGVTIPVLLRATFTDPDGAFDLASLAVDWDMDGTWDTTRSVEGLAFEELRHTWATPGHKSVVVRLLDRSGAEIQDTAEVLVKANAPRILSFREASGRVEGRVGDTLWFVASILDSSVPADLESITWRWTGRGDSVVSLRGLSSTDARFPASTSSVGPHALTALVRDAAGNLDSATVRWDVLRSPPKIAGRLRDSVLVSRDTATLWIDSLRAGRMGGSITAVHWSFGGTGSWSLVPSILQGSSVVLNLPVQGSESFFVVVRATQDNGETSFDTVRAPLMESFVDTRDGKSYPMVTIGTTTWMARNLSWKPSFVDTVTSTCAIDDRCDVNGRLYSVPLPLKDQPSSVDVPIMVSVCPDGWRLPSDLEFNELLSEGERRLPGSFAGQLLRARSGWAVPMEGQTDPLRFGAVPSFENGNQFTAWWTFSQQTIPDPRVPDPYPNMMNHSLRVLDENNFGWQNKYWSNTASIRCVRLKEIMIDSSWRIDWNRIDSISMPELPVRGLVPEVGVPVRIRATMEGASVETTFVPTKHAFDPIRLPKLLYQGPGRFTVELEVVQGDVVSRDTHVLEISAD